MNEIDQLEQELIALRQRFSQSLSVLEELSQVKTQFAELSETHRALQASLNQAKNLLDAPTQTVEPRLVQLESQMDTRFEQLQAQLTNLRFDFDAVTRQLGEDLGREQEKLTHLKQEREQMITNPDEPNRIKWIESSLQHLNSTIYTDKATLQKLDRRMNSLKRMLDIVAVAGFVGFLVLGMLVLVRQ